MTNKLSEEKVANTLRISQSLIGRTRLQITQDKGKAIIHTFFSPKKQSDTDASILFLILEDTSFGCYFPCDVDCKLVNTSLTRQEVEVYRNYCNSHYEAHKTADDSWYDQKLKTFIIIFFDTEENSYMLRIMDRTETDSYGVN